MPGKGEIEENPEATSLESRLIEILIETQEVLRFRIAKENPHDKVLEESIGGLATVQLVKLIKGDPIRGIDTITRTWSRYSEKHKLFGLAYSAYVARNNELVNEMLKDKKITVKAREGFERRAITYADGGVHVSMSDPGEVSGVFYSSHVNMGQIVLSAEKPTDDIKYWIVSLLNWPYGCQQLVDLKIEDAED